MSNVAPTKSNTAAIIVTYHPDSYFKERVLRVINQVGMLIVVDNNSSPEEVAAIEKFSQEIGFALIKNPENRGIAAALNQGVYAAIEKSYSWALLLDQDSLVADGILENSSRIYASCPFRESLSVIGARYTDVNSGKIMPKIKNTQPYATWAEQKVVMTSGSLLSIDAFSKIGKFTEEYFIESVDHEFCLRARKHGFKIIISSEPLLMHSIGKITIHKLFGLTFYTTNHQAERRYYMARNNIFTSKKYFFREPVFALRQLLCVAKMIFLVTLFESNKSKKLKHILKGIIHGFRSI